MKLSIKMQNWQQHNFPSDAESYVQAVQELEDELAALQFDINWLENPKDCYNLLIQSQPSGDYIYNDRPKPGCIHLSIADSQRKKIILNV